MSVDLGDHDAALRTLVLGLSRAELALPDALRREDRERSTLGYVAALSVRRRIQRPAPPAELLAERAPDARGRLAPPEMRRRLRALFRERPRSAGGSGAPALRALDALAERKVTLHPFDYPALESFMRCDPERLDAAAAAWLARRRGTGAGEGPAAESDAAWEALAPSERASHLRMLRNSDPAQARSLCAGDFAAQSAALRRRWLEAFRVGLSTDDVPFLRERLDDRAKSVVAVAQGLLASLPGTPEHEAALADARSRLELRSAGLLGRKRELHLDAPGHLKDAERWEWVRGAFAHLDPATLSESLDVSPDALMAACRDSDLAAALYLGAVAHGRDDFAEDLALCASSVLHVLAAAPELDWTPSQREKVAATLVDSENLGEPQLGARILYAYYEAVRLPLSPDRAEHLLRSKTWRHWIQAGEADRDYAAAFLLDGVALLPLSAMAPALAELESLSLAIRRDAESFAALVELIDAP